MSIGKAHILEWSLLSHPLAIRDLKRKIPFTRLEHRLGSVGGGWVGPYMTWRRLQK